MADDLSNSAAPAKNRSRLIRASARNLAQKLGLGVDLLYVEDLRKKRKTGRLDQTGLACLHERLKSELTDAAQELQCKTDCFIKFGTPAEEILRQEQMKPQPELILLGTQGRTGMKRVFLGSVAEEVIRHSKRPVLIVGPQEEKPLSFETKKRPRILVPTELGRNSRAAEQYALSLARRLGAEVVLFHALWDSVRVVEENVFNTGIVAFDFEDTLSDIRENAVAILEKKVRYFQKQGIPCRYKLEETAIGSEIAVAQEAKDGYSFIVMGTQGRSALMNAFFGSTARGAILSSPIPVIVVRSR